MARHYLENPPRERVSTKGASTLRFGKLVPPTGFDLINRAHEGNLGLPSARYNVSEPRDPAFVVAEPEKRET